MKKLLFPILFILVHQAVFAQFNGGPAYVYLTTDASTWQFRSVAAISPGPVTWATANGGTFAPALNNNNYTQNCGVTTQYTNPGPVISANPAPCNFQVGTVFYRTTFNVSFIGICDAILRVRADNAFRVYVNGQNVPDILTGCSNTNGLNGNLLTTVYSINITNFVTTGANTVIIEVINCPSSNPNLNPSYLSADLRINKILVGVEDAGFSIWLGSPNSQGTLTGVFDGTDVKNRRGVTNVSWLVEESLTDSGNGPWITIFSQNTTNTQISQILQDCKVYRVTRTVTNGCSTVSYTRVFNTCDAGKPGEDTFIEFEPQNGSLSGTGGETTGDEVSYVADEQLLETEKGQENTEAIATIKYARDNQGNAFSLSPNPATESVLIQYNGQVAVRVDVMDLSGRICASSGIAAEDNSCQIQLGGLPASGIYIVRFVDTNTGALLSAQKLQVIK